MCDTSHFERPLTSASTSSYLNSLPISGYSYEGSEEVGSFAAARANTRMAKKSAGAFFTAMSSAVCLKVRPGGEYEWDPIGRCCLYGPSKKCPVMPQYGSGTA